MRIALGLFAWWRKNGWDSSMVILADAWSEDAIDESFEEENPSFWENEKLVEKSKRKQKIALIPYQKNRENIKKFLEEKSIFHWMNQYKEKTCIYTTNDPPIITD